MIVPSCSRCVRRHSERGRLYAGCFDTTHILLTELEMLKQTEVIVYWLRAAVQPAAYPLQSFLFEMFAGWSTSQR